MRRKWKVWLIAVIVVLILGGITFVTVRFISSSWEDQENKKKDNEAPILELKDVTIEKGHTYSLYDFVSSCIDNKSDDCNLVFSSEEMTNFTEIGTHNQYRTALYQVPLQVDAQKRYRFGLLDDKQSVVYDAFFENTRIAEVLGIPSEELCVDLYGSKPDTKKEKYWLTTICADYRLEKSFGLSLRPQELNVMLNIPGTEIKLYNLSCHKDEKQGDSLTDYQ